MRIPVVLMRGGTSKGLFFREEDLPEDPQVRDRMILAAYGSPDPNRLQIDGVGGATSTTSKVAIIGTSGGDGYDITYTFGQVGIDSAMIDRRGNCGNMSSAVGPFAVDERLVPVTEPFTEVRFLNTNTNSVIVAHVPVRDGHFDPHGDMWLPGVPTTGAAIQLDYLDPGGAVTGAVLPTGRPVDVVSVPGLGKVEISVVDAANPLAFVTWESLGLTGGEARGTIDEDPALLRRLEDIRAAAGVLAGISPSPEESTRTAPSVPKLAVVGAPRDYVLADGTAVASADITVRIMMLSMGRVHPSIALTGAICTAVAAGIPGTLVSRTSGRGPAPGVNRLGHMSGTLEVEAHPVLRADGTWSVDRVSAFRTARRLLDGHVYVEDESPASDPVDPGPTALPA